ncbi:MAG TPA: NUDIX hydrolase [Chloroflexota bacterium]|nr:NUDIX hydrolase [Chloroflexota bacterium]
MAKLKTARAESDGGVVYREQGDQVDVVLVGREAQGSWFLPKGTPMRGESREQTAIRETREETGLDVRILEPITSISYWFMSGRMRIFKTVYYYLMASTGGDLSLHDPEYDRVAWFPIQQALAVLTYANDAEVVRRAAELIKRRSTLPSQQATRR